jgi:hypothetical protein
MNTSNGSGVSVGRPGLDLNKPLILADDQREEWITFDGDGVTFDAAAKRILDADAKDGERIDQGIAALNTWAFGPAPSTTEGRAVAALATIPAPGREPRMVPLRAHAFSQLCSRVGAPAPYIAKLPAKLQMACVNHGLQADQDGGSKLLRMAGGEARAILSSRYAPLDNALVIEIMRTTLREAGMLADVRVRSVALGATASMRLTLPGDDMVVANPAKVGDIVEVGFDLLNGEIGNRSISVAPMVWRLVCLNGMRSCDRGLQQKLRHVGSSERLIEAFRDAVPSALGAARGMRTKMVAAVDMLVDNLLGEFAGLAAFGLTVPDRRDVARDVMAERTIALPEDTKSWGDIMAAAPPASVYDVLNGMTHVAQSRGTDRRLEMEEAASAYLDRRIRRTR